MYSSTDPTILIAPLCCGLLFFVVLFAFLIGWRYLQYRETLALAEKGLLKTEAGRVEARGNGQGTLRWGVVFSALGLALTVGLLPIGINSGYPLGITPWMIFGFIPLFFGLGLILIYVLTKDHASPGNGKDGGGTAAN
jgi:hypothetical protein